MILAYSDFLTIIICLSPQPISSIVLMSYLAITLDLLVEQQLYSFLIGNPFVYFTNEGFPLSSVNKSSFFFNL